MATRTLVILILLNLGYVHKIGVSGQSVCEWSACQEGAECFLSNPLSPGTLSCRCSPGFTGGRWNINQGIYTCQDIDECVTGSHICGVNATCENSPGDYKCLCNNGRDPVRSPSGEQHCIGPGISICSTTIILCGSGTECKSLDSSYDCTCLAGFSDRSFSPTDGKYICQDIDECQSEGSECRTGEVCQNTVGSYSCQCPDNSNRWADPFGVHVCTAGDICEADVHVCADNTQCVSDLTAELYTCPCQQGYARDTTFTGIVICKDIDECTDTTNPVCEQQSTTCVNTPGSYSCPCRAGFIPQEVNSKCQDLDECSDSSLFSCPVYTYCDNVPGFYTCPCVEGYTKSVSGEDKCEPKGFVNVGVGIGVGAFAFVAIITLLIFWFTRGKCKNVKKEKPVPRPPSSQDLASQSGRSEHSSFTPSALLGDTRRSGTLGLQSFKLNGALKNRPNNGKYFQHSVTGRMVRSRQRQQVARRSQASSYVSRKSSASDLSDPSHRMDYFEARSNSHTGGNAFDDVPGSSAVVLGTFQGLSQVKGKGSKWANSKKKPGVLTLAKGQLASAEIFTVDGNIVTPTERVTVFTPPEDEFLTDTEDNRSIIISLDEDEIFYDHAQPLNVVPNDLSNSFTRPRSFRSALQAHGGQMFSMPAKTDGFFHTESGNLENVVAAS